MKPKLCLGLLLLAGTCVTQAQVRPQLQKISLSHRPLAVTVREGKTIVNAALEQDPQAGRKPDCSHLVHEVYNRAGYPYPYARSIDLYIGIGSFVRVTKPQPGDLIVWRGHVGIVVDPTEHSFYSSLRPGLRTDFYDAPQWTARGTARFFRYAAAKRSNPVLTENRPEKTRKNTATVTAVPGDDSSHEDLPDATLSATKSLDTKSPSNHATSEFPGGPTN